MRGNISRETLREKNEPDWEYWQAQDHITQHITHQNRRAETRQAISSVEQARFAHQAICA